MIPILYRAGENDFSTANGLTLHETMSCSVTEERNGAYTATAKVGANDMWFSEIEEEKILLAKPNDTDDPQPFRIYRVVKETNGNAVLYCEHIKERLSGIPIAKFARSLSAINAQSAMVLMKNNALITCPFTFTSDINGTQYVSNDKPTTMRRKLQGEEGSILQLYGGEYKYDKYAVSLLSSRGTDNNVIIEYGKNLKKIKQDSTVANTYSGIYPYWIGKDSSDNEVCVSGSVVYASNHLSFPYEKILPVDFTQKFDSMPTSAQLETAAASYITDNKINEPDISITVSFVPLWQAMGYEELAAFERISLCDTVHVIYPQLDITVEAKVVKTVYNVLKERYDSIEVGTIKKNLTTSLKDSVNALNGRIDKILKKI